MKLSSILILLLLMGGIVGGSYFIIDEVAQYTGVTVDDQYQDTFNQTITVQNSIEHNVNVLTNISAQTSGVFIITMVPESLKLAGNLISLPWTAFSNIVTGFQQYLNLPEWVDGLLIAIIGIALMFAVISLILRYPS
tara:strand:- start:1648 stop:2058 length:411 start_codon:yes stop_codon:yes gene_type:complete